MSGHESSISVILLPRDIEADLLDLIEEWTQAWMIRSAIWMTVQDCMNDSEPGAPPIVQATVIGSKGSARVDLFTELSRYEYELVRFISVRSVRPDDPIDRTQDEVIDRVTSYLRFSKPSNTTLRTFNVVFGATSADGGSISELIETGWDRNIVVSPEDRRSGGAFDSFTRLSRGRAWNGFVLAHICTVAGLWPNVLQGPYDDGEFDGFMDATHLQRVVIRGVLTGSLVVNIAGQAMERLSRDESPLTDPIISAGEQDLRLLEPEQEQMVISGLVEHALRLGDGQLSFSQPDRGQPLQMRRIGLRSQLREFLSFSVDKIKDAPKWLFRKGQHLIKRVVNKLFGGKDGGKEIDVRGILEWEDAQLQLAVDRINETRLRVLDELNEPLPLRRYDIDGELFAQLRGACFAWLDGNLQTQLQLIPGVVNGDTPGVVSSVSTLIPDWRSSWTQIEGVEADGPRVETFSSTDDDWLDVSGVRQVREDLLRRADRHGARELELRQRLGNALQERGIHAEEAQKWQDTVDDLRDELEWLSEDLEEAEAMIGFEGRDE